MEKVNISTDFITLGQFLKLAGVIDTGGMAKWFLNEYEIYVNDEKENRRGKKLTENDKVDIPGVGTYIVSSWSASTRSKYLLIDVRGITLCI